MPLNQGQYIYGFRKMRRVVGKLLLWFTQRFHLVKCRLHAKGYGPKGIIVIGHGRSGSTLLTRIIGSDQVLDLGEPLRTRKRIKNPWLFSRNSASQILSEFYLAKTNESAFVAHVKPYHTSYWGESWEDFVRENRKQGWVFIGLRRHFVDRWYSEMRARGRGSWTGDHGDGQTNWREFLDRDQFVEEAKRDMDFARKLNEIDQAGELLFVIDYDKNLATQEKQKELCVKLRGFGIKADLNGITTRHAPRPKVDEKGEVYDWMISQWDELFKIHSI